MDLIIYNHISDFYHFFLKDHHFLTLLENIDLLKNDFKDLFLISKCKKLFEYMVKRKDLEESKRLNGLILPELKGFLFDLISAITSLLQIHPVVKFLLFYFYITQYKCYDTEDIKVYFELSLRDYMEFFFEQNIVSILFERECTYLNTFMLEGLCLLNEAVDLSRKYLVNIFYRYHFRSKMLKKEYSETQSVFNLLDIKNKNTVNICAGNACGIHLLKSKITCIDFKKYMGMQVLDTMKMCHFIQCNIMDSIFESVVSIFNVWIAIHACGKLSIRIMKTFHKYAPESSELYLVPCCLLNKQRYKVLLDDIIYDRIYNSYYTPKEKKDGLRSHCFPAMHIELLGSLCEMQKFKIKTLTDMNSEKNKIIIAYK